MALNTSVLLLCIATAGGYFITALFTRLLFKPLNAKKIAGFTFQGFIPALLPGFAAYMASAIQQQLLTSDSIEKTIEDPALLQQLKPELESHIDIFLKDKLPVVFPLLSGMMGEKTKNTLKAAFLEEVETIFPSVMKNFPAQLISNLQPAAMIEKKLAGIDMAELEQMFRATAARQIVMLKLAGACTGFLIAVSQLLAIHYLV